MTNAEITAPTVRRKTILVVEDAKPFRLLVRELLEEAGYTVVDAEAPDAALRLLEAEPLTIDLVLTDIVMPRMSGPEFVKRLATIQPQARAVFMSGYSDNSMGGVSALAPGAHFVQKPFTMDQLMRTIHQALDTEPGRQ
jgi:two-component system cell cycle sensor histidine kinase/response regulator CckA